MTEEKCEEGLKEDGPQCQQEESEESQSIQEDETETEKGNGGQRGRPKQNSTTVDVMLQLMQSMQAVQQQLLDRETSRGGGC